MTALNSCPYIDYLEELEDENNNTYKNIFSKSYRSIWSIWKLNLRSQTLTIWFEIGWVVWIN